MLVELTGVEGFVVPFTLLLRRLVFFPSVFFSTFVVVLASVKTAGGVGAFSGDAAREFELDSLSARAFAAATSSSALRFFTAAVDVANLKLPGSPDKGFSSVYSSPYSKARRRESRIRRASRTLEVVVVAGSLASGSTDPDLKDRASPPGATLASRERVGDAVNELAGFTRFVVCGR